MRKAITYIFFLGMLLTTCFAHALVSPHGAIAEAGIKKERHAVNTAEGSLQISKDFVISDWEDYDEIDHDDHSTSLNKKESQDSFYSVIHNLLSLGYTPKTPCDVGYTFANFSRLPRYTYISLRVFRI